MEVGDSLSCSEYFIIYPYPELDNYTPPHTGSLKLVRQMQLSIRIYVYITSNTSAVSETKPTGINR
jgi:hypothetical protein